MILPIRCTALVICVALAAAAWTGEIDVQKLDMKPPSAGTASVQQLLPEEIAGVDVAHVALAGPLSLGEALSKEYDSVFLFIKGNGHLRAGKKTHPIEPETIALPIAFDSVMIDVAKGDTVHYVRIRKRLSAGDRKDMSGFKPRNDSDMYFTKFTDCQAYTEAIKSPKTVSRTVLPKDYVPRLAMGTVQTTGPDKVGAHEHPMLDQLFLGLADNDVVVYADDAQVRFPAYSLLHIPLGSQHWVEATDGCRMYYMWMDFFITKEGQEWLKTHQHVGDDGG